MSTDIINFYVFYSKAPDTPPRIGTIIAKDQHQGLQVAIDRTVKEYGPDSQVTFFAFVGKINFRDLVIKEALRLVCYNDQQVIMAKASTICSKKMYDIVSQQKKIIEKLQDFVETLKNEEGE
ncbi:hypothetical protein LCGC14_2125270 [marine sediment metagenome]|uniref:Uncharacterized protein n=1 Tax=marine sediment metagenome TaxID=412755 RepID=A0A0F9GG55_9ZZZZ